MPVDLGPAVRAGRLSSRSGNERFRIGRMLCASVELIRPFTLLAPFVGFLSAAAIAGRGVPSGNAYLGAVAAACLNAASNAANQVFDVGIDRINKPNRPLPSGRLRVGEAAFIAASLYLLAILLAFLVNIVFLVIVAVTIVLTLVYSAPPLRTKRFAWVSNITIAVPRGLLLVVAGWASVKDVGDLEPWFIGSIFLLFVIGAAGTKDFGDVAGDRLGGCRTLPVVFGAKKAARLIAPFLIFPFGLIALGAYTGLLHGDGRVLVCLSVGLMVWGSYTAWLLATRPAVSASQRNHRSWKHMYLMMLAAYLGLATSYLV